MKLIKAIVCSFLSASLMLPVLALGFSASAKGDYTVSSPYEDVVWSGSGAWGAYKGNMHSHTTYSDGDEDYPTMIKEYYEQGYDFLGMADHGVTGVEWNKGQTILPLYAYQKLIGKSVKPLTDEEYAGITDGTYPLYDGTARGYAMTCVPGGNELNCLTLTKCHVNGYFLGAGVGDGYYGSENGYEQAIAFVEKNGGLSHINHPGDWLETNSNPDAVNDPANIAYFANLLLKYDSCLGIEVFNDRNSTTGYDRILWDNLLMSTLPYGKTVTGFSNTDAHDTKNVDTSFSVFMMKDNTVESVKETMQSGALFAVTRILRANDTIGPSESINVSNQGLDYPMFTGIEVNGHSITTTAKNCSRIQWIANGKVIFEQDIADGTQPVTLDLDSIDGAEDFLYVRAELYGEGGVCITQAFVINDGAEPQEYSEPEEGFAEKLLAFIKNTRLYVIIQEVVRAIKNKLS